MKRVYFAVAVVERVTSTRLLRRRTGAINGDVLNAKRLLIFALLLRVSGCRLDELRNRKRRTLRKE